MSEQKKVLILCRTNLARDPRVYKQIVALKEDFELYTAGLADAGIEGVPFWQILPEVDVARDFPKGNLFQRIRNRLAYMREKRQQPHEFAYWSWELKTFLKRLPAIAFDVIWANDLNTLPLALKIAERTGAKVHFDAHEFFPGQHNFKTTQEEAYVEYHCRCYIPQASSMSTVSDGLKNLYNDYYNGEIAILENVPFYTEQHPSDVADDKIRLVHHGGAIRQRNLEVLFELMDKLDERFSLDLMLVKNHADYYAKLEEMAQVRSNVRLREPVGMLEIATAINEYDLGVYILPDTLINNKYALPNKLFEFIQARLGVAIGPTFQMAALVKEHGIGIVADDFDPQSLAESLNTLTTEQARNFKTNANAIAQRYSFDGQKQKIVDIVKAL